MEGRKCSSCGKTLSIYNPTHLCWTCQDKRCEDLFGDIEGRNVKVKDLAYILDISEEQVRRLWRQGRLPPTIPLTRELQWDKEFLLNWIRSQHKAPPAIGRQLEAFIQAHGGLHLDESTGEYQLGNIEDIPVVVFSKDEQGNIIEETTFISTVIPGHYEE